jgi:hypothetical protein
MPNKLLKKIETPGADAGSHPVIPELLTNVPLARTESGTVSALKAVDFAPSSLAKSRERLGSDITSVLKSMIWPAPKPHQIGSAARC